MSAPVVPPDRHPAPPTDPGHRTELPTKRHPDTGPPEHPQNGRPRRSGA